MGATIHNDLSEGTLCYYPEPGLCSPISWWIAGDTLHAFAGSLKGGGRVTAPSVGIGLWLCSPWVDEQRGWGGRVAAFCRFDFGIAAFIVIVFIIDRLPQKMFKAGQVTSTWQLEACKNIYVLNADARQAQQK